MLNHTSFTPASGKEAGVKSGIARNMKKPSTIVENVLADLLFARALIANALKVDKCKHCERSGPKNLKDLTELTKQLSDLSNQVLNRYRGRPSVESNLERHASVSDYVKALGEQSEILEELEFTPEGFPQEYEESQEN